MPHERPPKVGETKRVLQRRIGMQYGRVEYKVHWRRHSSRTTTWEPREALLPANEADLAVLDANERLRLRDAVTAWARDTDGARPSAAGDVPQKPNGRSASSATAAATAYDPFVGLRNAAVVPAVCVAPVAGAGAADAPLVLPLGDCGSFAHVRPDGSVAVRESAADTAIRAPQLRDAAKVHAARVRAVERTFAGLSKQEAARLDEARRGTDLPADDDTVAVLRRAVFGSHEELRAASKASVLSDPASPTSPLGTGTSAGASASPSPPMRPAGEACGIQPRSMWGVTASSTLVAMQGTEWRRPFAAALAANTPLHALAARDLSSAGAASSIFIHSIEPQTGIDEDASGSDTDSSDGSDDGSEAAHFDGEPVPGSGRETVGASPPGLEEANGDTSARCSNEGGPLSATKRPRESWVGDSDILRAPSSGGARVWYFMPAPDLECASSHSDGDTLRRLDDPPLWRHDKDGTDSDVSADEYRQGQHLLQSMSLAAFRALFPQQLIDFLLQKSIVLA